jgi:hypothetical protein
MKIVSVLSAIAAAIFSFIWLPALVATAVGILFGIVFYIATLEIDEE